MTRAVSAVSVLLCLCLPATAHVSAWARYTVVDLPMPVETFVADVTGVNKAGQSVGIATNAGLPFPLQWQSDSFATYFTPGGHIEAIVEDINDSAQGVGQLASAEIGR